MAVTYAITNVAKGKWGNKQRHVWDISVTGTYTAGGDVITLPNFRDINAQLARVEEVYFSNGLPTDGTVAYPATYIFSSGKIKFWETGAAINTGLADKGAGESLSTTTFRMTVISKY